MSSNSYLKHYIQTQSWLKNRNAWVLSLWFFLASGVLWLLKGKPNGAWYWLNRNQLLFTFCGICITSNSTKRSTTRTNLSPLTFFLWNQWVPSDSLQNTQAYTCLLCTKAVRDLKKLRDLALTALILFSLFTFCETWRYLTILVSKWVTLWHIRDELPLHCFLSAFVMVTPHQFEGKHWSITQPSLCLMDKKQFT